jgi:hypothetical protein
MTAACIEHYRGLLTASDAVLAESFIGPRANAMAKSHAFIVDLELWISQLRGRRELPVLESALREYQFALLSLTAGHYRAAFASLRLTLELSFAAVHWSANERELREWLRGQRDSNWATLIDSENGVLSKQFVRLFYDGLANEAGQYRASAAAVYRECSEYVHGNAHTHIAIPTTLIFDVGRFEDWHQKASVARLTISFVLTARYLFDFDVAARNSIEATVIDHLGHSPAIRALVGASSENPNG